MILRMSLTQSSKHLYTGTFSSSRRTRMHGLSFSSLPCCSSSLHNSNNSNSNRPVLLFDVMDTIVHDPFYTKMPAHFGLTFEQVGYDYALRVVVVWVNTTPQYCTLECLCSCWNKSTQICGYSLNQMQLQKSIFLKTFSKTRGLSMQSTL